MTKTRSMKAMLLASICSVTTFGSDAFAAQFPVQFTPVGAWAIEASAGEAGQPCILANTYDNGFVVRLSGAEQSVQVLSVDFKQDIFTKGQNYDVSVKVDSGAPANLQAKAFAPSILMINVASVQDFYGSLKNGISLTLDVKGNTFDFGLDQLQRGLTTLASCGQPQSIEPAAGEDVQQVTADPIPLAPVTAKPVDAPKVAAAEKPKEKTEEVYIKREKSSKSPFDFFNKAKKKEKVEQVAKSVDAVPAAPVAELKAPETVPQPQSAQPPVMAEPVRKMPEPIDLIRKAKKEGKDPAVEEIALTQQDLMTTAPAPSSAQPNAPVLVSRESSGAISKEIRSDKEDLARPSKMALFERPMAEEPYEPIIMEKDLAAAVPPVAPVAAVAMQIAPAPEAKPVMDSVAPIKKPETMNIAQASKAPQPQEEVQKGVADVLAEPVVKPVAGEEDFLQKSLASAEQEIQKSKELETKVADAAPVKLEPYEPITMPAPYEPIQNQPETAQAETIQKAPLPLKDIDMIEVPPLPTAGIKTLTMQEEKPEEPVALMASMPEEKKVMPEAKDVLDAGKTSVIPISVVRSKDIFVSRGTPLGAVTTASPAKGQESEKPAPKTWEAKAGEDIKIVMARWAERAGMDLVWDADRDGSIGQDIKVEGSLEEAVQQVMAQSGQSLGIDARIDASPSVKEASSIETVTGSLRSAMEKMAAKEKVKLVWNADRDFDMKQSLPAKAPFEETVRVALEQFGSETVRPVGHLNIDPDTGQKILMIETERSL